MDNKDVKEIVRKGYAEIAKGSGSCCGPVKTCCNGNTTAKKISKNIGYSSDEMGAVPEDANLGLGCGNPTALASLKEGETVIDLGSGAGFDCFLSANKVGKTGRVIGIDMTPEMIEKATNNAKKAGYKNVEFKLGEIENIPVDDNTADIIISNCVINLSPDKPAVFKEAYRTLKPGGRVMVSDIVITKELPDEIKKSVSAYVGCISGAIKKDDYLQTMRDAGFKNVEVLEENYFEINNMLNDPTARAIIKTSKLTKEDINDLNHTVLSIRVKGFKN